jgi:hypothetical protein
MSAGKVIGITAAVVGGAAVLGGAALTAVLLLRPREQRVTQQTDDAQARIAEAQSAAQIAQAQADAAKAQAKAANRPIWEIGLESVFRAGESFVGSGLPKLI